MSLRRSKENMSMTESDDAKFTELFEVIRSYSRRGYDHQDKALQIIAGTYVFMFELDEILEEYDYIFTTLERGNLDPLSVDAVVRVSLYKEEFTEWGLNRLGRILESLHRRSRADENYLDYVEDAAVVIRGLENIVAGSALEEIVEGTNGA